MQHHEPIREVSRFPCGDPMLSALKNITSGDGDVDLKTVGEILKYLVKRDEALSPILEHWHTVGKWAVTDPNALVSIQCGELIRVLCERLLKCAHASTGKSVLDAATILGNTGVPKKVVNKLIEKRDVFLETIAKVAATQPTAEKEGHQVLKILEATAIAALEGWPKNEESSLVPLPPPFSDGFSDATCSLNGVKDVLMLYAKICKHRDSYAHPFTCSALSVDKIIENVENAEKLIQEGVLPPEYQPFKTALLLGVQICKNDSGARATVGGTRQQ